MTWAKGQSGNPNGRRSTVAKDGRAALRSTISKEIPEIIKALIESAKAGDVQAARTLLERVLPVLKPEAHAVTLPELTADTTAIEQGNQLLRAIVEGRIAPDIGAQLLGAMGNLAQAKDLAAMELRLREVEKGSKS